MWDNDRSQPAENPGEMDGRVSVLPHGIIISPAPQGKRLELQDEVEGTTVMPDPKRMVFAQRVITPMLPDVATRAGLPAPDEGKPVGRPYNERQDVRDFIDRMVREHGFIREDVERLLFAVTPPRIGPPTGVAEDLPWYEYRRRFITDALRDKGVEFGREHDDVLRAMTARYHVDRRAVLGIAGVETRYGGYTGGSHVLESLVRLAFDDQRRPDYFKSELEALLLLGREHGYDLPNLEGSYAGALGIPQFMPSNYRSLGVSYSGQALPDLWNPQDAIMSIGNYFVSYDRNRAWQLGQPIVARARVSGPVPDSLMNTVVPLSTLRAAGVSLEGDVGTAKTGRLMRLEVRAGVFEHVVGLPNFETIRSYNPSNNYAMAVSQLGDEVLRSIKAPPKR